MKIALGSDHAGFELRQTLIAFFQEAKHQVIDFGTDSKTSVDYPVYAQKVAESVALGEAELGILICGSGVGMSMAANRVPGIRAALCTHEFLAEMARKHNNANVLCLGQRVVGVDLALKIAQAFVSSTYEGGRHQKRLDLMQALEKRS